jgi:hypothetical protein
MTPAMSDAQVPSARRGSPDPADRRSRQARGDPRSCGVRGQEIRAQPIDPAQRTSPRTANFFPSCRQTPLTDPTPVCSTGVWQCPT